MPSTARPSHLAKSEMLTRTHKTALVLFLGLAAAYICLSPGSISGQGYTGEEIASGLRMLEVSTAWMKGHPVPPMIWARHGLVPVLFDLAFLRLGKRVVSPDYVLSYQPCLLTAALVTLLFLWLRKLCSPAMSLFLAVAAAFGTMLWPYAYISLEPKQSFFVFLAGYLALADGRTRSWWKLALLALSCGLTVTLKSTGIVLWPVVAYLLYEQFRKDWRERIRQIVVVLVITSVVLAIGRWGASQFWGPRGGGAASFRQWMVETPLQYFANIVGVFGSPTKGFFVYAPVVIASVFAIPKAFRAHRAVVLYAALVTACMVGFISLLTAPADEVWGSRYMHIAIAPLVLCIGAAFPRFEWRKHTALVLLAVIGVAISFLGAFYYYGALDFAATAGGQNVMEWITGDSTWNPVVFYARLFHVWLLEPGTGAVLWTPRHTWVWTPPPDAMAWKAINLRDYCQPQSFLVRFWHVPTQGTATKIFVIYLTCLLAGIGLLGWVVLRTIRDQRLWVPKEA